jgi:hypothetical protein
MPLPLGSFRISDFDAYLRANNIPIDGVSLSSTVDAPEGISIQYAASATTEQQAWAETAKASFDWRKRRMLTAKQIADHITALTTAQQNAILRRFVGLVIRSNKAEVVNMLAEAGQTITLPYDEVDPNP